ncbi:hypothetical protein BC936DRAFT_144707 [Jimgerdemannia flammicorona]|uniref:Protein kinase domain-containing protein n=1 Tax=Jimgerdemannia flammicorona TaxID=994334 RepID=A0A433DBW4_9FUNG|nr:hypothetical protein BC936DRAFT_144707 [Jimgerdemannia flammicorona]
MPHKESKSPNRYALLPTASSTPSATTTLTNDHHTFAHTMASPAPIRHQLNHARLQEVKALLKPFDELRNPASGRSSDTLRQHLEYLNLLELSDFFSVETCRVAFRYEALVQRRLCDYLGRTLLFADFCYERGEHGIVPGGNVRLMAFLTRCLLQMYSHHVCFSSFIMTCNMQLVLTATVSSRTDLSELGLSLVGLSKYNDQYLMVMEYASGGNLEQILSDQSVKFESLHDLYMRAFYICSALRRIHDIGLTHMAVKFKPDAQLANSESGSETS